jgi:GT2 family glycosyltransferase
VSRVVIPAVEHPDISIVMVTYGQWPVVRQAIETLVANTDAQYELIVVDNSSPDGTGDELARWVSGARLVRLPRNVGFGPGANLGASHAVGHYLCFLNSDAFVQPGWLDPLLTALDLPATGAAIPMVLDPDGTLQEAGSLLGRDGTTLPIGHGESAEQAAYGFHRIVDYGSAVCLVMRRSTFVDVGGFDPRYEIAYYEDVDLALSLAEVGQSWRFEPASVVRHVRHGSSSHAIATELMLANRRRFVERWAHVLDNRPPLDRIDIYRHRHIAARDAPARHRILLVDDRVPHVDRGSGDPRAALVATTLAGHWTHSLVTLLAADEAGAARYAPALLQAGVEVVWGVDVDRWLADRRFHYDVVICSRPYNHDRMSPSLDRDQPQAARVYDAEALYFRRIERQAGVAASAEARAQLLADAATVKELEVAALQRSDVVLCVSDDEAAVIRSIVPETPVFVVAHCVEPSSSPKGFDERRGLLFFGGFMAGPGSPNEDGVILAATEVLPRLQLDDPELRLVVVGADPTERVLALAGDRIDVIGGVPDPRPWLEQALMHVAPHRFGSGIKLKLVDSMAAGLPFVTTPVGAEGLGLDKELVEWLVGDEPEDLARLARSLMHDTERWQEAQRRLLSLARERFGLGRFVTSLADAMAEVGIAPPAKERTSA